MLIKYTVPGLNDSKASLLCLVGKVGKIIWDLPRIIAQGYYPGVVDVCQFITTLVELTLKRAKNRDTLFIQRLTSFIGRGNTPDDS